MKKDFTGATFEEIARAYMEHYYGWEFERDVRARGRSGRVRQMDVAGRDDNDSLVVAEAKDHGRKLGIEYVDRFAGFLEDVGADAGVLFSAHGFTAGAVARAKSASIPIDLAVVQYAAPPDPEDDECPNPNCYSLDISWGYNVSTDTQLPAGTCHYCGTLIIRCPVCGTLNGEFWQDVTCDTCGFTVTASREWWDAGDARVTVISD